jgi:hypothetical protein
MPRETSLEHVVNTQTRQERLVYFALIPSHVKASPTQI